MSATESALVPTLRDLEARRFTALPSSQKLTAVADAIECEGAVYLTGEPLHALSDVLRYAATLAEEDEHRASVAADQAMCGVQPSYSPVVYRLIRVVKALGPAPEVPF